jgi:hypothetical protein
MLAVVPGSSPGQALVEVFVQNVAVTSKQIPSNVQRDDSPED